MDGWPSGWSSSSAQWHRTLVSMASCVPCSIETLAGMPVALGGTVTEDDGELVMIQVDRWYQGGDTDQVSLVAPDASTTSLGGCSTSRTASATSPQQGLA